jgi:hypothetical protein
MQPTPALRATDAATQPRPSDRRAHRRHRPVRRTSCLLRAGADGPALAATVQNLSAHGVALVVRHWVDKGAVLSVQLFNEAATFCLKANVRVTRRCTLPNGDYFIAGELDRLLEPAELRPFLI